MNIHIFFIVSSCGPQLFDGFQSCDSISRPHLGLYFINQYQRPNSDLTTRSKQPNPFQPRSFASTNASNQSRLYSCHSKYGGLDSNYFI